MANLYEISSLLKKKLDNPLNSLLNNNLLRKPLIINRNDILHINRLSKHLYAIIVKTNVQLYISTAVCHERNDFLIEKEDFQGFEAQRCLDSVYYDLKIML
jgi:hypothetical protein